jgi:ectoine hydroxylase-related dioxygenase (phytanoyl-CoA dioxygenase family)
MSPSAISLAEISQYHQDGYLIVKSFCSPEETERLYRTALADTTFQTHAMDLNDQSGKKTRLSLWYKPGNDVFGYLARSEKIHAFLKSLLGDRSAICHYHSKLMQKEPKTGGAWEWHQDYGYWYKNQFMFPDQMISVLLALTTANKANGCLQVIRGSHQLGRVNHGFAGEQVGADKVMVENALKTMPLVYCELQPGDALFFHSNLLHRSEANLSEQSRWSLISCYNLQSNIAYQEKSASWKTPLITVPDEAILQWEDNPFSENDFLKKEDDPALKDTGWENKKTNKST